jgi:hypothetical protein
MYTSFQQFIPVFMSVVAIITTNALLDPSEAYEGNLSDIRRETSRHFRNKKREYLKDKINELESNSNNKKTRDLYRGINEFKKVYQPRTHLVKMREAT